MTHPPEILSMPAARPHRRLILTQPTTELDAPLDETEAEAVEIHESAPDDAERPAPQRAAPDAAREGELLGRLRMLEDRSSELERRLLAAERVSRQEVMAIVPLETFRRQARRRLAVQVGRAALLLVVAGAGWIVGQGRPAPPRGRVAGVRIRIPETAAREEAGPPAPSGMVIRREPVPPLKPLPARAAPAPEGKREAPVEVLPAAPDPAYDRPLDLPVSHM
jgi:hypothetical protein